jgi:cysteine-S-conjugate beta-lyase
MLQSDGFNRRSFLRNAGLGALAVGVGGSPAAAVAAAAALDDPRNGKFDFDTPYDRHGTNCTKWDRPGNMYGKEKVAVGMGIADMDFRAAPCITRALSERMKHENWGYLDSTRPYIDSVVKWNKQRYGLTINPDHVVLTTGVHPGIIAALKTFSPPGSKVLLLSPTYNGFYGDLTYTQTKPEDSPMKLVNGRYSIDFDDFERRISHDTNTFILCNPQNPTGNCWSAEDMTRLGEICLRRRVVVLADEIHCDFVSRGAKYTPFASLPNKEIVNNSITFKAASKSFSLAAMKVAWFFTDNMDYLERVKANNRADLTTVGLIANDAAINEGAEWLDQCVSYIDGNHEFVESYIKTNVPMIKCVKPQGTYLSWLDVSAVMDKVGAKQQAAALSAKENKTISPEQYMERWFVEHAGVHLNAGSTYGTGGAGHMRMNIATARKTLEVALNGLAKGTKNI